MATVQMKIDSYRHNGEWSDLHTFGSEAEALEYIEYAKADDAAALADGISSVWEKTHYRIKPVRQVIRCIRR